MKPPGLLESECQDRSIPVLFHCYGEPAAQIARDQWGGRLGLWHRMLAQKGCVVVCIDNRGTPSPRGRAFRKCIYRQIGILAASDQACAAKKVLEDRPYLDPTRVGIWGWSGGGSMTLNLMFKSPEIYCTGVSVAPVPDMRCYDTIYQVFMLDAGLIYDFAFSFRFDRNVIWDFRKTTSMVIGMVLQFGSRRTFESLRIF